MIFADKSKTMLKYQKAKAKLVEYMVDERDYPNFPYNSYELSYPTTYILSRYSECMIENNQNEIKELKPLLTLVAQYYDSAVASNENELYSEDFLLSGMSAYFLSDDFGSSKVLTQRIKKLDAFGNESPQRLITILLKYLLCGCKFEYEKNSSLYSKLCNVILQFFEYGYDQSRLLPILNQYRNEIYTNNVPDNIFYIDVLYAIILKAINKSSWVLLEQYSEIATDIWRNYLLKSLPIKILWPAQQLIGEKEILKGKNAIVQLPTGVGKTKSIELIIRAAFLSSRASIAIIVAPLRALCNEITFDMSRAFGKDVYINQFSDTLQDDFNILFDETIKKQIIICTPEKLAYIVHHQQDFLDYINLLIFDEAHMFDDGSRGANYELLITHIRQSIDESQQLVLLSAVLPNCKDIKEWLFQENGILASNEKIVSTPKSVGFVSKSHDIFYFTNNRNEFDYFIPKVIRIVQLKKLGKEKKERLFPEMSSSNDIAIYNAIKLCQNGGVAIYMSQQRYIKTVFKRIIDLSMRDYDLSKIIRHSNSEQVEQLSNFMSLYYGTDSLYSVVSKLGVFPHSSNIPNGIKIAIEHALKHDHIRFVLCTSTLAQGVNIPIKYLFITSLRESHSIMKTRNFQNLIGRTARSGIYTEGSIIITDTNIYDRRLDKRHGGNYKWNECINMFDAKTSEPCSSSILHLAQSLVIDYELSIKSGAYANYIIEHYNEDDCFKNLSNSLHKFIKNKYPSKKTDSLENELSLRKSIIETIENYLCMVFAENEQDDGHIIANEICKNTLAYFLASEEEKIILEKLFDVIATKIKRFNTKQVYNFSRSMIGIDLLLVIEKWIAERGITEICYTESELFDMIITFFKETHVIKKVVDSFDAVCKLWIEGKMPKEIHKETGCDIFEIDECCSKVLSYELNFFIGNICDMISISDDEEQINPYSLLCLLQQKVKYGVPTKTAISICEKIFNDRHLSVKIATILGDDNIGTEEIVAIIKNNEERIKEMLKGYPEYFEERLRFVLH